MNEKIPQNMYDAFWAEDRKDGPSRMSAALLWLADNVSDEMVMAYMTHKPRLSRDLTSAVRESISAALRAAAASTEEK